MQNLNHTLINKSHIVEFLRINRNMSQRYKYIFYYQPPISYHVAELIKMSLHIPFIYSFFIVLYLLRGQTWKNKYAKFNDQGTGAAVVDSRVMGTDFI